MSHRPKAVKQTRAQKKRAEAPRHKPKASAANQRTDIRPTGKATGRLSSVLPYSSGQKAHVTHIPRRSEFLADVVGSVGFANSTINIPINPGLSASFAWLSQIAPAYEFYRFSYLAYEYRSTSGEVVSGNNPAIGKVVLATNYDVLDVPFEDKREIENYEGNASGAPNQPIIRHVVNTNGKRMGQVLPYTERYVRSGAVPSNSPLGGSGDPHAYDIGLFQLATSGMPADGNVIGELWVTYEIDLIKPKQNNLSTVARSTHVVAPAGALVTAPWLNAFVTTGSNIDVGLSPTGALTINDAGTFLVTFHAHSAGTPNGFSGAAVAVSGGVTFVNYFAGGTTGTLNVLSGGGELVVVCAVRTTGVSGQLFLTTTGTSTTNAQGDVMIVAVNSNMSLPGPSRLSESDLTIDQLLEKLLAVTRPELGRQTGLLEPIILDEDYDCDESVSSTDADVVRKPPTSPAVARILNPNQATETTLDAVYRRLASMRK
jgi:hypothetical protein